MPNKSQKGSHRRGKKPSQAELMYRLMDEKVPRIYTEVPVVMKSRYSQHVYRSAFNAFAETTYRVFDVMAIAAPQFADKIGLVIQNNIDEAEERLDADLEKARQMAEEAGINIDSINSTVVNQVTAQVTTPQSFQYLTIMEKLDNLAAIIQSLWMLKRVDSATRKNLLMGWQKHLVTMAYDARDLCIETVRRIVDQQRKARMHEKQKEQIHEKRMEEQEKIAKGNSGDKQVPAESDNAENEAPEPVKDAEASAGA
ncbi:hypothetical protein [Thiolapillus sp.]|nr:hypothetical protein [Thiolapillus sp.]